MREFLREFWRQASFNGPPTTFGLFGVCYEKDCWLYAYLFRFENCDREWDLLSAYRDEYGDWSFDFMFLSNFISDWKTAKEEQE